MTTFIRLWVAQTPWFNCKLTTRLDIEKSKLVKNLSCFSKRSLWLQWFPIASSIETDRIYLHERGWRMPEHKHWVAFLHLKCTMFQQQGCTGFTHRLYDLEYKTEETRFSFSLKRTLNSVSIFPQPTSPCTFRWKYWSEKARILHSWEHKRIKLLNALCLMRHQQLLISVWDISLHLLTSLGGSKLDLNTIAHVQPAQP